MLGWWISIYKQVDFDNPEKDARKKEYRLATWESAVNGIRWLDKLVEKDEAAKSGDGYPFRYRVEAKHVLPVISLGPPKQDGPLVIGDDYVLPGSWTGEVKMNDKNIADCSLDESLIIEVWDLS
jgi:hypothetical protein